MTAPYMTWSHLSLHQFNAFPAEKVRHLPIHSIVDIDEPVGAVPRWGELARVQPGKAAVEALVGRVGVFPGRAPRADV